jgi:hypothetical protein
MFRVSSRRLTALRRHGASFLELFRDCLRIIVVPAKRSSLPVELVANASRVRVRRTALKKFG